MENKKVCKACEIEKELSLFYKDSAKEDGLFTRCKVCVDDKIKVKRDVNSGTKVCKTCNIDKKLEDYSLAKRGKFGRGAHCKSCVNIPPKHHPDKIKKCSLCKKEKQFSEFSRDKYSKDGHTTTCLLCRQNKVRVVEEDISLGFKTCTKCSITKPLDCYGKDKHTKHGLLSRCKICISEYNNTPEQKEKRKMYREVNKEIMKVYLREYNILNNEKLTEQKKKYYGKNKKIINNFKKEWSKKRRKEDPIFKLLSNIRHNIYEAIKRKGATKNTKTAYILNCSIEEFKKHIESQFLPWMSWENYGNICETLEYNCSWDLDHIIPVNWAQNEDEVLCLNHWSNFQPLCSKVNRDIKKVNIYPCCNIELNITAY